MGTVDGCSSLLAQRHDRDEARAWYELVAQAERLELHPDLLDRGLLARYYSPERLAQGRERWVEPDLAPLRLPPLARA